MLHHFLFMFLSLPQKSAMAGIVFHCCVVHHLVFILFLDITEETIRDSGCTKLIFIFRKNNGEYLKYD